MDAVFTAVASAAMATVVRLCVTAGWERARTAVWRVLTDVDPTPGTTITMRDLRVTTGE
jgi:hypothetical protein